MLKAVEYDITHANVHYLDSALQQALAEVEVAHLNEMSDNMDAEDWRFVRRGSNAIGWRKSAPIERIASWSRTILEAGQDDKGREWKSSECVAVLLKIAGKQVLHVVTHFPSKAFTTLRWRRRAWNRAKRGLLKFLADIYKAIGKVVPTVLSFDTNRGGRWILRRYRLAAYIPTFGKAVYDRIFLRGKRIRIKWLRAFKTTSDHKALRGRVVVR